MIFKVLFGSYFPNKDRNSYISLCSSNFDMGGKAFKLFLFNALKDQKILDVPYESFNYDIPISFSTTKTFKCFVRVNGKEKLYCKLDQLVPYQKPVEVGGWNQPHPIYEQTLGGVGSVRSYRINTAIHDIHEQFPNFQDIVLPVREEPINQAPADIDVQIELEDVRIHRIDIPRFNGNVIE